MLAWTRRSSDLVSRLAGWGDFITWSPSRTSDSASSLSMSVLMGLVVVDTWAPLRTRDSDVSVRPSGERWCCDQVSLEHPQICRGFRSTHESQLTPHIPTRMSSVGSPATDSRLSHHYLCCDRNTTVQPIQIK